MEVAHPFTIPRRHSFTSYFDCIAVSQHSEASSTGSWLIDSQRLAVEVDEDDARKAEERFRKRQSDIAKEIAVAVRREGEGRVREGVKAKDEVASRSVGLCSSLGAAM